MQYSGVVDAVKRMLADEGIAGFYKGESLWPRVLREGGFHFAAEALACTPHSEVDGCMRPLPTQL